MPADATQLVSQSVPVADPRGIAAPAAIRRDILPVRPDPLPVAAIHEGYYIIYLHHLIPRSLSVPQQRSVAGLPCGIDLYLRRAAIIK